MKVLVCSAIMDAMVSPLQERMDDWKKSVVTLDREHAKGKLFEIDNIIILNMP